MINILKLKKDRIVTTRVEVDGIKFDSKVEAEYYNFLKVSRNAELIHRIDDNFGVIRDCMLIKFKMQVRFNLLPAIYLVKYDDVGFFIKNPSEKFKKDVKKNGGKIHIAEREVYYIADFIEYWLPVKGKEKEIMRVVDVKGRDRKKWGKKQWSTKTPDYILKRKLMLFLNNIKIKEVFYGN